MKSCEIMWFMWVMRYKMLSARRGLKGEPDNILGSSFIFTILLFSLFLSLCGLWLSVVETVPPDLLILTSACVKLRMAQRPPLQTCNTSVWNSPSSLHFYHEWQTEEMPFSPNGLLAAEEEQNQWLCGTLGVAVHSACGLQHPACTTLQTLKVLAH